MSTIKKAFFLTGILIILDQIFKIWIKTTMIIGERITVIPKFFYLYFTENNGMAFGLEFGGDWFKMTLTLFRLVAVTALIIYMIYLYKKGAPSGLLYCLALIVAGAMGNLIDSMFYGLVFGDSYAEVATFLPEGGGYDTFLHGKVVDMLYFPIIDTVLPEWFPFNAGKRFIFFSPIFNLADSAITVGVFTILLFQRKFLSNLQFTKDVENQAVS